VSNPTKPFRLSRQNVINLGMEFANQVQLEEEMGLPVAPFMVPSDDEAVTAKRELGFINFIVSPLFTELEKLLPEIKYAVEEMAVNAEFWRQIQDNELSGEEACVESDKRHPVAQSGAQKGEEKTNVDEDLANLGVTILSDSDVHETNSEEQGGEKGETKAAAPGQPAVRDEDVGDAPAADSLESAAASDAGASTEPGGMSAAQ
jgi:hypothetical protein